MRGHLLPIFQSIRNIKFKKNLKTLMLVGLAVTMGLSLAEPGASLALAEASKNQELKSDYGRVTSLDSSKLSAKKEVISDPIGHGINMGASAGVDAFSDWVGW